MTVHDALGAAIRDGNLIRAGRRARRAAVERSCQKCGQTIERDRARWAPTCADCSAEGCPNSPEDALNGRPCDACDCVPPERRQPTTAIVCGLKSPEDARTMADWIKEELRR